MNKEGWVFTQNNQQRTYSEISLLPMKLCGRILTNMQTNSALKELFAVQQAPFLNIVLTHLKHIYYIALIHLMHICYTALMQLTHICISSHPAQCRSGQDPVKSSLCCSSLSSEKSDSVQNKKSSHEVHHSGYTCYYCQLLVSPRVTALVIAK